MTINIGQGRAGAYRHVRVAGARVKPGAPPTAPGTLPSSAMLAGVVDMSLAGQSSPGTVAVAKNVPAGVLLSVLVGDGYGYTQGLTGITDSVGNTYAMDSAVNEADGDGSVYVAHSYTTAPLSSDGPLNLSFETPLAPDVPIHDAGWAQYGRWSTSAFTTLARTSAWASVGTYSCDLASPSDGNEGDLALIYPPTWGTQTTGIWVPGYNTNGMWPVTAGTAYTWAVDSKPIAVGGDYVYTTISIDWYSANGTLLSTSSGGNLPKTGVGTTKLTATAPTNAHYMVPYITIVGDVGAANLVEFYVDNASLSPRAPNGDRLHLTWTGGANWDSYVYASYFSGPTGLSVAGVPHGTADTTPIDVTITPATGDLLIAYGTYHDGTGLTNDAGHGWTDFATGAGNANNAIVAAYQTVASASSVDYVTSGGPNYGAAVICAYH